MGRIEVAVNTKEIFAQLYNIHNIIYLKHFETIQFAYPTRQASARAADLFKQVLPLEMRFDCPFMALMNKILAPAVCTFSHLEDPSLTLMVSFGP